MATPALTSSGDGRHDRHLVAVLEPGLVALEEADVLLVDVDVDEPPELSRLVQQALAEARELPLEVADDVGDAAARGLHLGAALRKGAERCGNPYQHGHQLPPCDL